jgi:uncharacterized PurR-regulated membrane protein YhhQ (DUF165 family)
VTRSIIHRLSARNAHPSSFRFYDLLVHIFVVILLISNLVGQKICIIPFIRVFGQVPHVSGAQLLFPLTYIFADVFTEVYGYGASRRAIWLAFFSNIILTLTGVFVTCRRPPLQNGGSEHVLNLSKGRRPAITWSPRFFATSK